MTAQMQEGSLERTAARLDEAMGRLSGLDPATREIVDGAVDALNQLHMEGLTTVVRRLRDDERGRELLYELVDDPHVRMLLSMHGIIRPDPMTLAARVIEQVRPGLQSHGGDVELSHIADGVAYVRLQGACNGCSMASVTMRNGVEEALVAGVPGLRSVEVLPTDPSPTLIPVDQLTVRPRDSAPDQSAELRATGWSHALDLSDINDSGVRPVTLRPEGAREVNAVIVSVKGQLTAYVNACVHEARPLDDALVDETAATLTCPWHGLCFDATSGECLTLPGAQLEQLPLRIVDERVWVRARGA